MSTSPPEEFDPEDILSSSLQTLYEYQPITLTSAGSLFTYTPKHVVVRFDSLESPNYTQPAIAPENHEYQHLNSHSIVANSSNKVPKIELYTPDTHSANWSLHASAIWMASLYLADHIDRLGLPHLYPLYRFQPLTLEGPGSQLPYLTVISGRRVNGPNWIPQPEELRRRIRILELGAAAGLPGITISNLYSQFAPTAQSNSNTPPVHPNGDSLDLEVTVSDYPDERLIQVLSGNADRNGVLGVNCRVIPYAWGTDPGALLECTMAKAEDNTPVYSHHPTTGLGLRESNRKTGFDIVMAADTLWNPSLHSLFAQTLSSVLKKAPHARVHLVAGLHTGRWTIQGFLNTIGSFGLIIESIKEYEVNTSQSDANEDGSANERIREWDVEGDDDDVERRRWVIWIVLKWPL